MVGITLKLDPNSMRLALNSAFLDRAQNLQPLHARIAMFLESSMRENFMVGGRPDKWKASRRSAGQRGQPLRDTNRLMNSITNNRGEDHRAVAGTNDVRAAVLNFGAKKGAFGTVQAAVKAHIRRSKGKEINVRPHTRRQQMPWGDIPARPFAIIQDDDVLDIQEMVGLYLTQGGR